jgi:predicted regulator of Ras-like GTPase activity (Roadblock/LC7/MglB family)
MLSITSLDKHLQRKVWANWGAGARINAPSQLNNQVLTPRRRLSQIIYINSPSKERIDILSDDQSTTQDTVNLQKKGYSTSKALNNILRKFDQLDWVKSSAVIRRDGILMASDMMTPTNVEAKRAVAIMGATIVGAAKNITAKCRMGFPKALLVCITVIRWNAAIMMEEINRVAQKISTVL